MVRFFLSALRKVKHKRSVTWLLVFSLLPFQASCVNLNNKQLVKAYYQSYNYEKMADYKDAIRSIMPVYEKYPRGYTVNLRLGWLYYLNKNYADSIKFYKNAEYIIPSSIEPMLGMALPLMAQKRWSEVEDLMYKVIKIDYYNYYANLRLAIALRMENKLNQAKKIVDKMLALYPTDVNFLDELGLIYFTEGKKKYAKSVFGNVLVLDPQNVIAKVYYFEKLKNVK